MANPHARLMLHKLYGDWFPMPKPICTEVVDSGIFADIYCNWLRVYLAPDPGEETLVSRLKKLKLI